ncbi:biotin--[acetyl-CoA-carboxylase] ligase [Variovorax sp. NFACC27]|uniref:biotin--[acetyl-CoA-carboxylase] ligase n=1 Tax=unclassified Variovorax TaxID=663243 RepID=UPI000895FF1D|nr:BirA family transcriptional regulator, biotin operon repressor / biotin-[acetyl-CoA-carboxylase] ligase [Variovorax sp. NFACC28]SEG01025.1 BirA family transcriptional regulator, biotin operon repressor / biotin-[acetyl-CoA-carboxylase] ligase [Variovorax sp. NFACC29]SFB96227.1 BirA family transcriptional regulator, biotin operon repressor / biotin-[acetyl-CoA-carboxylase] ligase [Variovorax sp. NFACC26]SFF80656.1 BirA family transcriptional regulator, biotin operon repressor / biotin-[acetyl-
MDNSSTADWFQDRIAAAITPLLPGFAVEAVAEIDSTNTELMRRARAGRVEPVLLVTERQTAGRGRLGRPWQSGDARQEASASLMFSLGLPLAPADWSGLSLAVGVSVAESLDPSGAQKVGLKWPNDVWVNDRKLVGILVETALPANGRPDASRYLVIGIGVNIGAREADGMRTPPAWVHQWRPSVGAPEVLGELVLPLVRTVLDFETRGFAPFAERFAARDVLRGREVTLSDGTAGLCEGVTWGGELQVRTDAGLQLISSDEVSVRPRGMAF